MQLVGNELQIVQTFHQLKPVPPLEWLVQLVDVYPGIIIYIEPFTPHRLFSELGVRTIVFGTPALNPDDEYFDEPRA